MIAEGTSDFYRRAEKSALLLFQICICVDASSFSIGSIFPSSLKTPIILTEAFYG